MGGKIIIIYILYLFYKYNIYITARTLMRREAKNETKKQENRQKRCETM